MASIGECEKDLKNLRRILKSTLVSKRAIFSDLLTGPSLSKFAEQMYQARLITDVQQDYGSIVKSFKILMDLKHTLNDLEDHCREFFNALEDVGGPLVEAAKDLEKSWMDDVKAELNIDFIINRSLQASTDDAESTLHKLQQNAYPVYYSISSHDLQNILRQYPQLRQSIRKRTAKNIKTKRTGRYSNQSKQSMREMLKEEMPSSQHNRRTSDITPKVLNSYETIADYRSEAIQSEYEDNNPQFATSMQGIYNHGYSDPYLMDERSSSQLPSIPEEDTPISSKEASHSSTEATNTVEQDTPYPYTNDTSSQLSTERDEQWSNAGTSTNTSDISHPTQLAEGMENNIPTFVHPKAISDQLSTKTGEIRYEVDNATSDTESTLLAGSEETKIDLNMDAKDEIVTNPSTFLVTTTGLSKSIAENGQVKDLQGRLSQLETQMTTLSKFITENGQVKDLQGRLSQLETQMTTLSKSITENGQVKDLQGRLSQLETQMTTLSKSITENGQVKDLQGRLSQLETQMTTLSKSITENGQVKDLQGRLSQLETQMTTLSKFIAENGQMKDLQGRLSQLETQMTTLITQNDQVKDLQGHLSQLETQVTTLSKSVAENNQVKDLQGRLSQLETQVTTLSKFVAENDQVKDLQGRLSQLETQLKAINKSHSKSETSDQLEDLYSCLSQVETQLKLLSKSHSENGLKEKNEQIYRLNIAVISLFVLCLILTVGIALCAILVLKNS